MNKVGEAQDEIVRALIVWFRPVHFFFWLTYTPFSCWLILFESYNESCSVSVYVLLFSFTRLVWAEPRQFVTPLCFSFKEQVWPYHLSLARLCSLYWILVKHAFENVLCKLCLVWHRWREEGNIDVAVAMRFLSRKLTDNTNRLSLLVCIGFVWSASSR
jgi:hypothetical protein